MSVYSIVITLGKKLGYCEFVHLNWGETNAFTQGKSTLVGNTLAAKKIEAIIFALDSEYFNSVISSINMGKVLLPGASH